MRKIAIVTDSASDITADLQEKFNIRVLPFKITSDSKSYTEGVDFTPLEYYKMLREVKGIPTTSQITLFEFMDLYKEYENGGYTDIILVTINSGGSATNDAAHIGLIHYKEENPDSTINVHIVDSHTYSMGYGQAVCDAAQMIESGEDVESILNYLKTAFEHCEIVLVPYTLKFIKQSGRISAAAAFAGDILGFKPIITLIQGKSILKSKVRGDKQVFPALISHFKNNAKMGDPYMIATTDMDNAKEFSLLCEAEFGYAPLRLFYLGCCVTTNTGPDTIAIIYRGKE